MVSGDVISTHAFPVPITFLAVSPQYDRAVCGDRVGAIRVIALPSVEVLHEAVDREQRAVVGHPASPSAADRCMCSGPGMATNLRAKWHIEM